MNGGHITREHHADLVGKNFLAGIVDHATAVAIDNPNESSAELSRLMRHMAVNRGMRRPQAVIPLVTP